MTEEKMILQDLIKRYPILTSTEDSIWMAYQVLEQCFDGGGKLLIAGNGGSCADAEHIVGELMKGFKKARTLSDDVKRSICEAADDDIHNLEAGQHLGQSLQGALPAIALTGHSGLATAFLNDVDGELIYAQQLYGYGKSGDVFLGISTSGNARNIDYAVTVAKARGIKVLGLTGKDGGSLGRRADTAIIVPETETFKIQELHLPIYHALCLMLEEHFF